MLSDLTIGGRTEGKGSLRRTLWFFGNQGDRIVPKVKPLILKRTEVQVLEVEKVGRLPGFTFQSPPRPPLPTTELEEWLGLSVSLDFLFCEVTDPAVELLWGKWNSLKCVVPGKCSTGERGMDRGTWWSDERVKRSLRQCRGEGEGTYITHNVCWTKRWTRKLEVTIQGQSDWRVQTWEGKWRSAESGAVSSLVSTGWGLWMTGRGENPFLRKLGIRMRKSDFFVLFCF